MKNRVLRITGVLAAFTLLSLAVPLPHVDELRNGDLSAVALGAKAEAAQSPLCDKNPKAANLNFVLKDSAGRDFNLASQKGKVILLDFWATWCPPCKVEIPWFVEFQQKYGPAGLQVVGVSVDDTLEKLQPYVTSMEMNYIVLQGLGHNDLFDAYGPMVALPMTLLISREGQVCMKHTGLIAKDALERQIKGLL